MKHLLLFFFILLFAISAGKFLGSWTGTASAHEVQPIDIPQTGWSEAVPSAYKQPAAQQGSVVRLDYDSLDYNVSLPCIMLILKPIKAS